MRRAVVRGRDELLRQYIRLVELRVVRRVGRGEARGKPRQQPVALGSGRRVPGWGAG